MPLQGLLMADDRENEAGEECLGLLVPVRVLDLGQWVGDEGVGQGSDMLVQIEAVRGRRCQRVVGAFSPFGSTTMTERLVVSRFGRMAPVPLPERVGAGVRRWATPLE